MVWGSKSFLINVWFWEAHLRPKNKNMSPLGASGNAVWVPMGTFKEGTKRLKPNSHSLVAPLKEGLADF